MNEMRKLMEAVGKIDESYFSRMAAAIDELIVNNPNLSQDKLVAIVRSKFGQEAATYLSDKFESEADLDDWENSDPQPHMREDEGDDKKEFLDKLKGVPKEPLYVGFDQSGDIERAVNVKLKGEDHEIHGYDHADRPNLIKVTVGDYADNMQDLFYDKDLKKIVDPLDKDFDAWMDQNPFEEVELEENPLIGMAVRAAAAGAGKAVADKVMDEDEVEESFRDKNDPIVKQIKSLLKQGKSVISRLQGAAGVVSDASVEDGTITYKDQNFGENVTFKISDKEGLELVGQIDHYSLVARSTESVDEDIASWMKRLDKKAGAWITKKADTMIAKKVAEIVREEGINDAMISVQYLSGGGGKTIKSSLESYLKHSPEGEYAEEVRYILPALDKDTNDMRDAEISAFGSPLDEAKGKIVQVPAGLRGEGHNKTGNATSDDAEEFVRELGIDDQIDTDVVDPETGELLFTTGTTKRKESKKGNYQVLNYDDFTRGAKLREPESPVMHSGWDWENDIEKKQDNAWELLRELRDSDFYNVVWKNAAELVDKPDMGTDDEEWADLDYDVDVEIPVAIKRKDGKRFTEDDHDNFREIVSAVKKASTMGNFGISYAGTSNKGTVARFVPSFM